GAAAIRWHPDRRREAVRAGVREIHAAHSVARAVARLQAWRHALVFATREVARARMRARIRRAARLDVERARAGSVLFEEAALAGPAVAVHATRGATAAVTARERRSAVRVANARRAFGRRRLARDAEQSEQRPPSHRTRIHEPFTAARRRSPRCAARASRR